MTVDATAGEVLSLRYLKSDGALHRAFSGQVVGSDSWGTWLLRTADINVEFGDGTQGKFPHPAVTLVPDLRDRWWSLVLPVVDGVCLPTKLYGNVGRPSDDTNAERSALSIIDLELDVVWSDDRFVVVDLDEFEAARNDYAPGVAARAERTANDLVELLAAESSVLSETATWYAARVTAPEQYDAVAVRISKYFGWDGAEPEPTDLLESLGIDSLALAALAAELLQDDSPRRFEIESSLWRARSVAALRLALVTA